MNNEDLTFQRYAHDKLLGGASPTVDGGPLNRKKNNALSPRAFHENTSDKTLTWELEQAIDPLKELLK